MYYIDVFFFLLICFRVCAADFESEQQTNEKCSTTAATDANSTDRSIIFSSEEDNPLNWDPVVEACNKHVTLSQVDSGRRNDFHKQLY